MDTKETFLWEILVPTVRRADDKPIKTRYHRVWDEKVRAISGGLTIMPPAKGQWVAPHDDLENGGKIFSERMIPVRFIASRDAMERIVDMTTIYYDQLCTLCYMVGTNIVLRSLEDAKINIKRGKTG